MDMADTGLAVSGGVVGVIGAIATAFIRAQLSGAKRRTERVEVSPDPLRVEIQKTYATKDELRDLEERFERKLEKTLDVIRADFTCLRQDIRDNDEKAEARSVATHKRIDSMKDICVLRGKGCK